MAKIHLEVMKHYLNQGLTRHSYDKDGKLSLVSVMSKISPQFHKRPLTRMLLFGGSGANIACSTKFLNQILSDSCIVSNVKFFLASEGAGHEEVAIMIRCATKDAFDSLESHCQKACAEAGACYLEAYPVFTGELNG